MLFKLGRVLSKVIKCVVASEGEMRVPTSVARIHVVAINRLIGVSMPLKAILSLTLGGATTNDQFRDMTAWRVLQ
jgi:hypothetical protein